MDYHPLGNTGLTVSVAGLGCGGNSRLGLGRGASFDECVGVARAAIDLGVNFLDTAEVYGTEEIVGAAVKAYDRDKLVISTKALFKEGDTAKTVTRKVEASLKRLGLDHVDIFHFHAVRPAAYEHHRDVLAPALLRLKEQGKVRHVGLTETGPRDPDQAMLSRAVEEAPWEVIMLAYSLVNQGARTRVFPVTRRRGIGTLLMFVVRNIFSNDAYRRAVFAKLVEDGRLDASVLSQGSADGDPARLPRRRGRRGEHHRCGLSLCAPRRRRRRHPVRHRQPGACEGQHRVDLAAATPRPGGRAAAQDVRAPERRRAGSAGAGEGVETCHHRPHLVCSPSFETARSLSRGIRGGPPQDEGSGRGGVGFRVA